MKNQFVLLCLALSMLLGAAQASAQMTTQLWAPGWDNFNEPLDLAHSSVTWSVAPSRKLTVTFTLAKATPNKLYQVGAHIFCTTFPATFGQFPANGAGGGNCGAITVRVSGLSNAAAKQEKEFARSLHE